MRRENRVTLRFNEKEYAYLQEQSRAYPTAKFRNGRDNFSEYLRRCVLRSAGYRNEELEQELRQLNYELRKIGTNVNQIAHKINGGFGSPSDLKVLMEYLSDIKREMKEAREEARKLWRSQS